MSITEQLDASSYLVAPTDSGDDFIGSLEADAGLVLGGVDWAIHKFFHVSVIGEIVKPITGDWNSLERAGSGWSHAADAARAVGTNFAAVPGQTLDAWTGDAADAFRARMQGIAASMNEYGDGATMISEVVDGLVETSKAAAEVIAGIVGWIGDRITSLLIELAVPLIGWAAAAGTVAATAGPFFARMEKAYQVIKKVADAVEKVIDVLYKVLTKLNKLKTLADNMVSGARVFNATFVDSAAANSFGTAS